MIVMIDMNSMNRTYSNNSKIPNIAKNILNSINSDNPKNSIES